MTQEQFDKTKWGFGVVAKYHQNNREYIVASVDFSERLIGLSGVVEGSDELTWVRCENVTITGGLEH